MNPGLKDEMMKKDLIDITDLTTEEIDELIAVAEDILKTPEKYSEVMRHRKIATLFYEPSTRTRFSFESAMLDLGGSVIGFSSPTECSVSKGESVADTARTAACFADVIAMRHFKDGAAFVAASNVDIPVINAGDGGQMHPTQTLTDLFTIHMEKGGFDNLTIGLCGDLKYGRTVHSLIAAMARYKGVKFILISPEELKIPEAVKTDILEAQNLDYVETDNLEEVMPQLDVLYMTRVQRERFRDQASYERLRDVYILDNKKLESAKPDMCILHPLPRVNEIAVEVDEDPRAAYFRQVRNGKFVRMALIMKLIAAYDSAKEKGETLEKPSQDNAEEFPKNILRCGNSRCISGIEQGLKPLFKKTDSGYRCIYCDTKGTRNG